MDCLGSNISLTALAMQWTSRPGDGPLRKCEEAEVAELEAQLMISALQVHPDLAAGAESKICQRVFFLFGPGITICSWDLI